MKKTQGNPGSHAENWSLSFRRAATRGPPRKRKTPTAGHRSPPYGGANEQSDKLKFSGESLAEFRGSEAAKENPIILPSELVSACKIPLTEKGIFLSQALLAPKILFAVHPFQMKFAPRISFGERSDKFKFESTLCTKTPLPGFRGAVAHSVRFSYCYTYCTAAFRASTRSVCSQRTFRSSRPMWP